MPETEGGAVGPAEGQTELPVLPRCHVPQVHDAGDDLPGHEAVVVVELAVSVGPQIGLVGLVREAPEARARDRL